MSGHSIVRRALVALLFVASSGFAHAQFNARVQAIHNAPDPALTVIDLYVADMLVLDDVPFRTASPYLDIPAFIPLTGGIAPGNSTGPDDVFFEFTFTLGLNETYQFILIGVRDPGQFLPNPDGRDISLDVLVIEDAREASTDPGMLEVLSGHGSPDVPTIDMLAVPTANARKSGGVAVAYDLTYRDISEYVSVAFSNFVVHVISEDGTTINEPFLTVIADPGEAITLLTTGFLDSADNQNGEEFTLMVVHADGRTNVLQPFPVSVEPDGLPSAFTLHGNHPNPFNPSTTVSFDLPEPALVSIEVFDVLGRNVLTTPRASFSAGARHVVQLDATSLSSGLYVYCVLAETSGGLHVQTGRMTLVK